MAQDKKDTVAPDVGATGVGTPSSVAKSREEVDRESSFLLKDRADRSYKERLQALQAADHAARIAAWNEDQENYKEAQELWKKFYDAAASVTQESKRGYSTGPSTLLQLAALCELAAKANWKENGVYGPILKALFDGIKDRDEWVGLKHFLASIVPFVALTDDAIARDAVKKEIEALSIQTHLDFVEVPGQGAFLDKHSLNQRIVLSDGTYLPEEGQRNIALQMQLWLFDNGFWVDRESARIFSLEDSTRVVPAEELRTLRDDPTTGLTAFLKEKFHLEITAEATHSSSPGMG